MFSGQYYFTENFHDALASGNQAAIAQAWMEMALYDRPQRRLSADKPMDEVVVDEVSRHQVSSGDDRSTRDNTPASPALLESFPYCSGISRDEREWRNRIDKEFWDMELALSKVEGGRNWR